MKAKLKPKHSRFVANYVANGCKDATQAALSAGYTGKNVRVTASKLLTKANIQAAIADVLAKQQVRCLIDKDRILAELARIATCDIAGAFDANGNILPIKDMPEDVRRAISSIEVESLPSIINKDGEADGEGGTVTKIKFWDKPATLRDLGKHFRLFVDRIEVNDVTDRAALLAEARKRADEMKDAKPETDTPKP